jgi:hypothetical protein
MDPFTLNTFAFILMCIRKIPIITLSMNNYAFILMCLRKKYLPLAYTLCECMDITAQCGSKEDSKKKNDHTCDSVLVLTLSILSQLLSGNIC